MLTTTAPFTGTEAVAGSLSVALQVNGHEAEILSCNSTIDEREVRLLTDPALALIMTTGLLH